MKTAYQFCYKITPTSQTQYVYVIAVSYKQAWYFFLNQFKDKRNYYYIGRGNYDITEDQFNNKDVKIGSIYGSDAII